MRSGLETVLRRGGGFAGAALLVTTLTACAYVHPYVDREHEDDPALAGNAMRLTKSALTRIHKWEKSVDDKHKQAVHTRRGLHLLTFGLGTAVAARAVMEKSAAATRNMSLGAGAIYAGNSLFLPTEQVTLYNSATRALACVRSRAAGLRANVASQKEVLPEADPLKYITNSSFKHPSCLKEAATKAVYEEAKVAHDMATAAVRQAELSDAAIAAKIEDAARNVVITLNEQLDLQAPSQDAILAAARSSAVIAASIRGEAGDGAEKLQVERVRCGDVPAEAPVRTWLAQQVTSLRAVETAIRQQINAIGSLDTACTLTPVQVAPLTLDNSEITLAKDSQLVVDINGGQAPYRWVTASGTPPPASLMLQIIGDKLVLTGKSTLAGGPYKIEVLDRSSMPNTAPLTINVAK